MSFRRRAFTLVELLVCIGIFIVLLSIFIPYVAKQRETSNRVICSRNLAKFAVILREYANRESAAHGQSLLPSVIYDPAPHPETYTAFTGPDDSNPFAPGSRVKPNDVTASLFLLMRQGYISNGTEIGLSLYVCPSSDDYPDRLTDAKGKPVKADQRSNFRSARNLSYGYCSPFSSAPKFRLNTDWLSSDFAVMADKGPGKDATIPPRSAPPIEIRKANSNNHGEAGQNVLYGDGHVAFKTTPYCGYGDPDSADNIYTAAAPVPTTQSSSSESGNGYFGRKYAPSSWGDSYLVPSESDE